MKEQIEHGKVNLPRPRKLKYWAFIVFLALLSSCQGERRTISVSGEGRVTFVPDTVSFTITVRNLSPTLKEATTLHEKFDFAGGGGGGMQEIRG